MEKYIKVKFLSELQPTVLGRALSSGLTGAKKSGNSQDSGGSSDYVFKTSSGSGS